VVSHSWGSVSLPVFGAISKANTTEGKPASERARETMSWTTRMVNQQRNDDLTVQEEIERLRLGRQREAGSNMIIFINNNDVFV